jgi:hypothetical protein
MTPKRTHVHVGMAALVLAAGVSAAGLAQTAAQQPPPIRVLVTTTSVKPDMIDAFQNLIRAETVPANKKAGVLWRWVFAYGPLSGDAFRYLTVIPVANFSMFDQPNAVTRALGPEGAAKYNAKLRPMILSQHFVVQTLQPNLSIQTYSTTPPALALVNTIDLIPGKAAEFTAIQAEQYLPAMKKAAMGTDYLVFNTNYGGPPSQRTIVQYLNKYADLDQTPPLQRVLGVEGAQQLNQRRASLFARNENAVYRFVPDLSYGAPAPPKK